MDLSLAGVFLAGVLTFLSPCVLPLVPIYLGILAGEAEGRQGGRFRTVAATAFFSIGFTMVFSLMGLTATAVGQALARNKMLFQQLGGVLILLMGLRFLGWLQLPFLQGGGAPAGLSRWKTRFHFLNVFLLGMLFAFAWSPCIGSVLGSVLTWTSLRTTDPGVGALYLTAYGGGFAVPLLVIAAVAGPALAALRKARRFIPVFERVTGGLLVAFGLMLITDQAGLLDRALSPSPPPVAESSESPAMNPFALTEPTGSCSGGEEAGSACGVAEAQDVPRMIKFFSPTCPICLQMIPTVNLLRQECRERQVGFESVDVSTPTGKALARKYGVTGIPVFVFEDASGREVARLVGRQTLGALEQAMSVLIGEQCPAYREVPALGAGG